MADQKNPKPSDMTGENAALENGASAMQPADGDPAQAFDPSDKGASAKGSSSEEAAALDMSASFEGKKKPSRLVPLVVGICAVVVLVAVAAGFALGWQLPGSSGGQPSAASTAEVAGAGSERADQGSESDDADGADAEEAEADGAEASEEEADGEAAGGQSQAGQPGSSGAPASSESAAAPSPEPAPTAPAQEPAPAPQPSTITVSVSIDSSRAAGHGYPSSMGGDTVTIPAGSTVYDALVALGVSVGGSSSYVSSIGGLAEFACGATSGWLYFVNGSSPGISCGSYELSGGESIAWIYTLDMGNDI